MNPATIQLNGEPRTVTDNEPLPAFLDTLDLGARNVLVELNGAALLRAEWPATRLRNGDRLEIIRVVAGG